MGPYDGPDAYRIIPGGATTVNGCPKWCMFPADSIKAPSVFPIPLMSIHPGLSKRCQRKYFFYEEFGAVSIDASIIQGCNANGITGRYYPTWAAGVLQ